MPDVTIRTNLKAGDVGTVIHLHGVIHADECGFDPTFEAYVAVPLADFIRAPSPRGRIWLAECDGQVVGCIAIVPVSEEVAQLRWFLVAPSARGAGLGRRLLDEALCFCRTCGFSRVILWTVSSLQTAARLYRNVGFRRTEEKSGHMWGVDVVEEKYELELA